MKVPLQRAGGRRHRVTKAVVDRVGAVVLLVVLSPLFLAGLVAVRLSGPGPLLHRRRVIGLGGREFDALKLRTMSPRPGGRSSDPPPPKTGPPDGRVTPVGRVLRRWSVDELPQLVNVLKGDMSLVGPRILTLQESLRYGEQRNEVHSVRPGITGPWQVGGRSNLDFEDRIRLDLEYVRRPSIGTDLVILLVRTPIAVVTGLGAR